MRNELEARNDEAYLEALRAAGLEPAPAPGPQELFDGAGPGADEQIYVTGTWSEEDTSGPPAASFATDRNGSLWHVARTPLVDEAKKVIVKGCRQGYSGGITPAVYEVGYRLPPGVKVLGVKRIEFRAEAIAAQYKKGACDHGAPRP